MLWQLYPSSQTKLGAFPVARLPRSLEHFTGFTCTSMVHTGHRLTRLPTHNSAPKGVSSCSEQVWDEVIHPAQVLANLKPSCRIGKSARSPQCLGHPGSQTPQHSHIKATQTCFQGTSGPSQGHEPHECAQDQPPRTATRLKDQTTAMSSS